MKERVLPPITFSESEAKALFFACQSLRFYRDLPFEEETDTALKKFLNCLSPDMQHSIMQIQNKVVFWTPDRHCNSPLLRKLFCAVTESQTIEIRYSSMRSDDIRKIIPIGLYAMNGLWYCPAYCTKSEAVREFRADRILEISQEPIHDLKKPPIPTSIHEYLNQLEVGLDFHLKIKLTSTGVRRCESEFLLAKGLQVLSTGDGIIELNILKSTLEWVADYLLPLGKHATVLQPIELLDLMKEKSKELYALYCNNIPTLRK